MANQATSIVGLKEFLTANFAATLDEALISDLATTLAPRIEEWLGGNYRAGHKDGWEQAQKEIVARLGSFAEDLVAKIEKALGSGERKDASVSLVDLILLLAVEVAARIKRPEPEADVGGESGQLPLWSTEDGGS